MRRDPVPVFGAPVVEALRVLEGQAAHHRHFRIEDGRCHHGVSVEFAAARGRLAHVEVGDRLAGVHESNRGELGASEHLVTGDVGLFGDLDGAVDGELVTFRGIKRDLRQQLIDDTIADLAQILIHDEDGTRPTSIEDCFDSESIAEALRYVKRDYAFFDAVSRSGNDMQMYDRVKNVLKQMLLTQAARTGVEPHYGGIPRDYALEILVSAVSSIIWLWIRRGCKETPKQICAIIERNKNTAPVDILH